MSEQSLSNNIIEGWLHFVHKFVLLIRKQHFYHSNYHRQGRLRNPAIVLYTAIITLLLYPAIVQANVSTNLSVTVQNEKSVPLSGVHVIIKELSWGEVSGWDGELTFEAVPAGSYTLEATHIGYKSSRLGNIAIHSGSSITKLILILQSESVGLPDAEVYGTRESSIIFNRESITILPKYWLDKGARNVGEALSDVPGITILQGDGRQRISLRGSPPHGVEVTLDDIPLSDAGTGTALIDRINLDHIQAINIEFSGLGGAVRLLTEYRSKLVYAQQSVKISVDRASNEFYSGNVRLDKSIAKLKGLVQISGFTERGDFSYLLDNGKSLQRVGNDATGINSMMKLSYLSSLGSIDAGIYYDESYHGVPGLIFSSPTPEATLDNQRVSIGFHHAQKLGRVKINSLAFFSNYSDHYQSPAEQYDPISGTIINHYRENNRQRGRRLGLKTTIGSDYRNGGVKAGYQVQSDEYSGVDLIRNTSTIGRTGLGSARRIVQDIHLEANVGKSWQEYQFDIISKLSQKYIDNRNLNRDKFTSPGITVQVNRSYGNQNITVHSGWGRSFVSPSFNAVFLENNMFAVGNKKLKPERGENIHLGLQYSLNTGGNGRFSGYINGFKQRTTDLIVWKRNSFGKYFPDNEDEVSQLGIELNLNADRIKGFISLHGSYIYNRSVIETAGDINRGNVPPLMAKNSGTMRISVDYFGVNSSLSARWSGIRYSTASNYDPISVAGMGLPPYTIWDFYFVKKIKITTADLSVQFGMDNIFNRNYRLIERSPMPGREFRIRATYEF